jgi:ubiquinone/menaquinone biosynthesis C-methylase UbiE
MPANTLSAGARIKVHKPQRLSLAECPINQNDLGYSVRRYFIDEFFMRQASALPRGSNVLDIGGFKGKRRGRFDISRYDVRVTVANISRAANPDVLCDAGNVPLPDESFDVVILAEVVEHLPDAPAALSEAGRLLRPGGVLLATAPFMFRVHPDPIDVARYAPDWWSANLSAAGFEDGEIEPQGALFSVMAELARGWAHRLEETRSFWPGARETALSMLAKAREWAITHEEGKAGEDAYFSSFTTGFGVRAVRGPAVRSGNAHG